MWEDVDIESIDEKLIEEKVYQVLDKLNPRHAVAVMLRNGFGCHYKEIGEVLKISASRASQIEAKALRILRSDKYKKEFVKLGIPWIDNHFIAIQREEQKEREEGLRFHRERVRKQKEKRIEAQKLAEARKKLRIVDSDIPKPEMKIVYTPRAPYLPPFFVKLLYNEQGPYLHVDSVYGSIDRNRDPVTYDRWLKYLLQRNSTTTTPELIAGGAPPPFVTMT